MGFTNPRHIQQTMQGAEITTQALPIGQFVESLKSHLKREQSFRNVVLKGELSKFHKHHSGHVYLTLKDSQGQLDGVMWRAARTIPSEIKEGKEVVVIGSIDLYPPQGRIQLVIDRIQLLNNIGLLEAEKRKLVEKLKQEGALDRIRKPMPLLPKHIVILTGSGSAALADMLRISTDRFPNVRISVIGISVQGDNAVPEICKGIDVANSMTTQDYSDSSGLPAVDLIILARGGGAPEDLWAFNLEPVARKILEAKAPLISAIGHESDVLVSDLVADVRASTPSNAIEIAVPDFDDLLFHLSDLQNRKEKKIHDILEDLSQKIEILQLRLSKAPLEGIKSSQIRLGNLDKRLTSSSMSITASYKDRIGALKSQMNINVSRNIANVRVLLEKSEAILKTTNPKNVLNRGYTMMQDDAGKVITSISQIDEGQKVEMRLKDGIITSKVESKRR